MFYSLWQDPIICLYFCFLLSGYIAKLTFVTASLLMFPGHCSIFLPILTMLYFGRSRLILRFPNRQVFLPSLKGLQLVPRTPTNSTAFIVPWNGPSTYHSFRFIWFSICGLQRQQSESFSDHWGLNTSKSQVSRILFRFLTDLNNSVVCMVYTRPLISKLSCPFINPLVRVARAPIAIGITVTFMFHSFFSSLARSKSLYFI